MPKKTIPNDSMYNVKLAFHKKWKNKTIKNHEAVHHFMKLTPRQFSVYRHIAKAQVGGKPSSVHGSHIDVSGFESHPHAQAVAKVYSGPEYAHKMMDSEPGSGWFDWGKKAMSFVSRNIPKVKHW